MIRSTVSVVALAACALTPLLAESALVLSSDCKPSGKNEFSQAICGGHYLPVTQPGHGIALIEHGSTVPVEPPRDSSYTSWYPLFGKTGGRALNGRAEKPFFDDAP